MSMECIQRCPDCPLMENLGQELLDKDAIRQRATANAHFIMSLQNIPHGYLNKTGMRPETQAAVTEKFTSFKQGLGQDVTHIFEMLDEHESRLNDALQTVPESCEQPRARRKYILFGQRILQCTSNERRRHPADLSWRPVG